MTTAQASSPASAGPSLDQFAGLGYLFLVVSGLFDVEFGSLLRETFGRVGEGLDSGLLLFGILIVAAVAIFGLYFRRTWGLVGSIVVFGLYGIIMLAGGELTIAGVAILCVLYLLSRADIVLDAEY